ncbi:MAG: hypothetical protein ACTIJ6_07740 [Leucobacter sp.]
MIAVLTFVLLIGLLALFQLALVCGAPWGRFAWGGQHTGKLPSRFRIASGVAILIYALIAMIALTRVSLVHVLPSALAYVGMWVVFVYLVLGVLMNAISRSKAERFTMTPVALVLAVLALLVALSDPISA